MFRKTITRLAYSPALAEELTAYARQLRHEEVKRQIGLIFVALALVVQSFAVLFPPESANAGNTTDFIEGGFSTIDEYLSYYDRDSHNIKDLLSSLGISRADIQTMHTARLEPTSDLLLWKMVSRGEAGDTAYEFIKSDGTTKTAYYQSAASSLIATSNQSGATYVGSSSSAGQFALLKNSGNLVTKTNASGACSLKINSTPEVPIPVPFPDITRCSLKLRLNLTARNLTEDTPATSRPVKASDRIMYTLTITNNENQTVSVPLSIGLADLLDYAQLIDKGGASFNQETKSLGWTAATIPPGASLTRNFIMKLFPVIPSTATGQNDPSSYDCVMRSSFGETLSIPVSCPLPKVIEGVANELPPTSVQTNLTFAVIVVIVAAYFYARSRQLRTELRLIRHNYLGSL